MSTAREKERQLVRALLGGDEAAFRRFFNENFSRLYRFAMRRCGNEDMAEEAVQRTLCQAVRKLDSWRGEAALYTWLCSIARNEINQIYRSERAVTVPLSEDLPEVRGALESLLEDVESGPESSARRRDLVHLVEAAMDGLPARYGDALEWKYMEGLSVCEIAQLLETSEKATESLLTRARNAFRDAITTLMEGHGLTRNELLR